MNIRIDRVELAANQLDDELPGVVVHRGVQPGRAEPGYDPHGCGAEEYSWETAAWKQTQDKQLGQTSVYESECVGWEADYDGGKLDNTGLEADHVGQEADNLGWEPHHAGWELDDLVEPEITTSPQLKSRKRTKKKEIKKSQIIKKSTTPKVNKNQGLREEEATIMQKFSETILTKETCSGVTYFECKLCKVI